MKDRVYVTTPLYYVNAKPHIGHAYTTVACDVYARYWKEKGKDVFFLTGTDEHGQKVAEAAAEEGKDPKEFCDEIVSDYKKVWQVLDISYDKFIRTTDVEHKKTVQKIFELMQAKGDIYKDKYKGLYCVPCETYFLETDLEDKDKKICPDCGRKLRWVEEDSYFFRLSKYEDALLKYYEKAPDFLEPSFRAKEMINFIKQGLRDLCITRSAVSWGVPMPGDETHSIYVWFDALINYISAIGFLDYTNGKTDEFLKIWPADVHFVGKEIFKFHTIIWPAMLLSLDIQLPHKVFGHGWWTVEGEKMSKSKGNVIDPVDIVKEYSEDSFRYFILREVPFGNDGDFSIENFMHRYNSDLANDLGNLCSRLLKMINKYCGGQIPDITPVKNILWDKALKVQASYDQHMQNIDFYKALIDIWELVRETNKYIEDNAPWHLAKDPNKEAELQSVLWNSAATLRIIAHLSTPFMPRSSHQILTQLGIKKDPPPTTWQAFPKNTQIGKVTPIFPRKS